MITTKEYHAALGGLYGAERTPNNRGFATPIFCAVGGLTQFAFARDRQKQIELNVGWLYYGCVSQERLQAKK